MRPSAIREKTPADAAEMLSEMSDENYRALMRIIISVYNDDKAVQKKKTQNINKKKRAFMRMQELREDAGRYYGPDFDAEKERAEAMEQKYGRFD